ncbi:MAG: SatD family protein [Bacteroidota bacterium]
MSQADKHFILMSDIINSSSKQGDSLMKAFKDVVADTNREFSGQIISPLTITLGDEFQGVVRDLQSAIDIIFYLDEQTLNHTPTFSLRHVVNYGSIKTPINPNNAHEMLGDGLTKARGVLNQTKDTHIEVVMAGLDPDMADKLGLAFELYRSLYNHWSKKDRKIAFLFLMHNDYRTVAKEYGRDPSSMWRREKSLKMREFYAAKKLIRKIANG